MSRNIKKDIEITIERRKRISFWLYDIFFFAFALYFMRFVSCKTTRKRKHGIFILKMKTKKEDKIEIVEMRKR